MSSTPGTSTEVTSGPGPRFRADGDGSPAPVDPVRGNGDVLGRRTIELGRSPARVVLQPNR